jgi:hypothetical protein
MFMLGWSSILAAPWYRVGGEVAGVVDLDGMSQIAAVPLHDWLVRMVKTEVPMVFLNPDHLSGLYSLCRHNRIHRGCCIPQLSSILGRPRPVAGSGDFSRRKVGRFDGPGQHLANAKVDPAGKWPSQGHRRAEELSEKDWELCESAGRCSRSAWMWPWETPVYYAERRNNRRVERISFSFIHHQMLLKWSNLGGWDSRGM